MPTASDQQFVLYEVTSALAELGATLLTGDSRMEDKPNLRLVVDGRKFDSDLLGITLVYNVAANAWEATDDRQIRYVVTEQR